MTDFRALCADLLRELDHASAWDYQQALKDQARAALAESQPAADGEVGELVAALGSMAQEIHRHNPYDSTEDELYLGPDAEQQLTRAAELLERLSPQPIPVSERLPEAEDCDAEGRCWLGGQQMGQGTPTWLLGFPAWAERFPEVHRYWLPAHALPLPSGEVE